MVIANHWDRIRLKEHRAGCLTRLTLSVTVFRISDSVSLTSSSGLFTV